MTREREAGIAELFRYSVTPAMWNAAAKMAIVFLKLLETEKGEQHELHKIFNR